MRYFVTYGDAFFEGTMHRLIEQVKGLGLFDKICSFSPDKVSSTVKQSEIFRIKRGGGLWIWKPDIIYSVLCDSEENDIIIYCDAGCSVYKSKEWNKYFELLDRYDIIVQKIFQKTYEWTRKELIRDFTPSNGTRWELSYQFQATILLKNTSFTRQFVKEWRDYMLRYPEYYLDVEYSDMSNQHTGFIESRHDQSIYSALVYKYLNEKDKARKIYVMWEHIEDKDIIFNQAIRATRIRSTKQNNNETKAVLKRLIKDYIYKPLVIVPTELIYKIRRKLCN